MPTTLHATPPRRIVTGVADAALHWRDPGFRPRDRAIERIAARTGYSTPVVEYALDRLFEPVTADALESTIAREFGGRRTEPIGRVAIISSRTTIGVAIIPAIFALCARCDVVVKDREDALVSAFFETLSEQLDAFAAAAHARAWNGAAAEHDLGTYDAVAAFGGDDALQAIRAQLAVCARFIPYGPKASIGYVVREALGDETVRDVADGAARDLVLYDGEGCLNLHALFVERGGAIPPDAFAPMLAAAVERAERQFPLGPRTPARAAGVARARDLALFRDGAVYSNAEATFVIEMGSVDRAPGFLPRVLAVHAVDGPAEMIAYVEHHRVALEACAIDGARDDVAAAAVRAGANRIARFGELQAPPLDYTHGGHPRVADFVRFVTETP